MTDGVTPVWFWPGMVLLALVAGYSVHRMAAVNGSRWVGMATAALFGVWDVVYCHGFVCVLYIRLSLSCVFNIL